MPRSSIFCGREQSTYAVPPRRAEIGAGNPCLTGSGTRRPVSRWTCTRMWLADCRAMRRHELPASSTQRPNPPCSRASYSVAGPDGGVRDQATAGPVGGTRRGAPAFGTTAPCFTSCGLGGIGPAIEMFCDQRCGTTARRSPCRSWRVARSVLGLPVARYGPDALVAALGDDVEMVMSWRGEHTTSTCVAQPFSWVVVRLSSGHALREG
jgi:hypothetical protein